MLTITMFIVMGLALAGNIAVIKYKLENERYADAGLDATILFLLAWVFGESINGLIIANIASAVFSIYLLWSPPNMDWINEI